MIFEAFVAEDARHRVRRAQTPGGDFQPPWISRQRSRQLGEPLSQEIEEPGGVEGFQNDEH